MTDAEKEREYNEKINSLPALEGFGPPQKGFIPKNVEGTRGKIYATIAEAQRAALANPDCSGFTSSEGGWKLRGAGTEKTVKTVKTRSKGWYDRMDISYLKNEYHTSRRDEL